MPRPFNRLQLVLALLPVPFLVEAAFVDRTADFFTSTRNIAMAWCDVNNDGYPELCTGYEIYFNNGGTSFTHTGPVPGYGPKATWADMDNDGFVDVFASRAGELTDSILTRNNDGAGSYTEIALPVETALTNSIRRAACWADLDGDGFVEIYAGGYEHDPGGWAYPDFILGNQAGSTFTLDWTQTTIYKARSVIACDFDEDGDMDIYVSNYRLQPNLLWLNSGAYSFTEEAGTYGVVGGKGHSIGSCWGDMDNDGHFDLFVGNFSHRGQPAAQFLRNQGSGGNWQFTLEDVLDGADWQESYASPSLADYDNDGDLDLYYTTVYNGDASRLYRNDGNWVFTDVTAAEGLGGLLPTYQAAWADFDRDGFLDLMTNGKLFHNQGNANHWLEVTLKGNGTTVNRSAIGAQARIDLGGGFIVARQVEASTGEGNMNDLTLHFGLGANTGPVNVDIFWPDATTQTVYGVAVDQHIVIESVLTVANTGATGVTQDAASLTGDLAGRGQNTTSACVMWGPTDLGQTHTWPNQDCIGDAMNGGFSIPVSGLAPNTTYFYICYATNDSGEAWSDAATSFTTDGMLPFEDSFDTRSPGELAGQGGWQAGPTQAAVVQSADTHNGSGRALDLTTGMVWHAFSGPGRTNILWTDFQAKPVPQMLGAVPAVANDPTAIFHVQSGTGYLIVYDGTNPVILTNQPAVAANTWARFTVRSDYTAQTWDLWLNGAGVARNLDFYSSARTEFGGLRIFRGEVPGNSFFDEIAIGPQRPAGIPFIDDDADDMDDDWEILHFGSITVSAGSVFDDQDFDGFRDKFEFVAGTDPMNAASLLEILPASGVAGTFFDLTWSSVSNKSYAIAGTTNVLGAWTLVFTNVPATPPTNTRQIVPQGIGEIYRVEVEE